MKNKKLFIIIPLVLLFAALSAGLLYLWNNLQESEKQNIEFQELMALEQEEMLNDLQTAQMEYDELKKKILSNDSLLVKLEQEQLRTQQLYEELQNTKATNAAEIKRLKKELKTLRAVLEDYMVQIDSLYRENAVLKDENTKLIAGKKRVEKERNDLAKEKEALTEKVDLAAQLDATDVAIAMLRSNGKTTSKVKNAKQISVSCTISKNITASTGDKIVYVRIMQPDGEPLTKGYSNTFKYQNRDISYSMNKSFEFSGEEQSLTLYWNIEETLQQGRYRAYIFVDGNIIGEGYADFE
jgi:predicted  nucleic acid-binding Zn-ribbon protein